MAKRQGMLRRRHQPQIAVSPVQTAKGFDHLGEESIAVLAWLRDCRVEFVLVGAVAEAVRGGAPATGHVAIVPAPYRRNFERLRRGLVAVQASVRPDDGHGGTEVAPGKISTEMLGGERRWMFSCAGGHWLEVEGRSSATPGYQELLYEAARFELADGLHVEVASPEHIVHYAHLRRTGAAPEMRITRVAPHAGLPQEQPS